MQLILASSSPRRRELLQAAGFTFTIRHPSAEAECGVCSGESPPEFVARLAYQKAADVATHVDESEAVIIACDTVAECVGRILGKPVDTQHARQMLELLSGREHRVYSGVCVWHVPQGEPQVEVARTTLRMDKLTPAAIDEYLGSGLWEGKAGAFGYQDRQGWLHVIEGSESNVVGLPLETLTRMLAAEGVAPQPPQAG
jgi:septum formation protein